MSTLVTVLIPEERRDRANGLVGTTAGVSFLVTSVISGLLVAAGGMFWVLILAVVVLALALLQLALVRVPHREPEPDPDAPDAPARPRRRPARNPPAGARACPDCSP